MELDAVRSKEESGEHVGEIRAMQERIGMLRRLQAEETEGRKRILPNRRRHLPVSTN